MARLAASITLSALLGTAQGFVPSPSLRSCDQRYCSTKWSMKPMRRGLTMVSAEPSASTMDVLKEGIKSVAVGVGGSKPVPEDLVAPLIQAIAQLDKANADIEPLERLASFLGTLFVKHEIAETDKLILAAVAKRRPKLEGRDFVQEFVDIDYL